MDILIPSCTNTGVKGGGRWFCFPFSALRDDLFACCFCRGSLTVLECVCFALAAAVYY